MGDTMQQRLTQDLTQFLASLPEDDRIKAINEIRMAIHQVSPFREEPVDCVLWVKNSQLMPNDYNGNDSTLLIVFYVQIMPDDFVMQLHRF